MSSRACDRATLTLHYCKPCWDSGAQSSLSHPPGSQSFCKGSCAYQLCRLPRVLAVPHGGREGFCLVYPRAVVKVMSGVYSFGPSTQVVILGIQPMGFSWCKAPQSFFTPPNRMPTPLEAQFFSGQGFGVSRSSPAGPEKLLLGIALFSVLFPGQGKSVAVGISIFGWGVWTQGLT